ncbi:hypothetical protein SAMN05660445_00882 [Salegentibacter salarius]|nr:hypothetical protein SAMN05660445_00882 [Salegentibacter salarius]
MLKPVSNRTPIAIGGARLQRLIVLHSAKATGQDGQSSSPARTVFIRDVGNNLNKDPSLNEKN